jgi:Fe-S oxidoreductase
VSDYEPPTLVGKAVVHGHCHQKSLMGMRDEASMLKKLGLDAHVLDNGCCGMAGSFGFEHEHYDVSLKVAEHELLPSVRDAPADAFIVADGFSCREQIARTTGRRAVPLADLTRLALDQRTSAARRLGDYPERQVLPAAPRVVDGAVVAAGVVGAAVIATLLLARKRRS